MKKFLIIAALLAIVAVPGMVRAQMMDTSKVKKVPRYIDLAEDEFIEKSDSYIEKPPGDPYLAYEVRLPDGWSKIGDTTTTVDEEGEKRGLNRRLLGKIATYRGPTRLDALSRFEVRALELDHEISAKNWFLNHILSNGYTLEGMEELTTNRIEALYVLVEGDTSYIVRTVAEINGSRMVLASYMLPEAHWNAERAVQDRVIQSFRFMAPEKVALESTHTYSFLNLLRFDYPISWRLLAPEIFSIEGMDAKLVSSVDNKTLMAEIEIHIYSTELDTTLAQEVQYLRKDMEERGLIIGKLIEAPEDFTFHDHIFFSRVEAYEVTDQDKKAQGHEFWLAIMVEDRYYYIVTMLTLGRQSNFYTWAKNTEAFETVIESLRP